MNGAGWIRQTKRTSRYLWADSHLGKTTGSSTGGYSNERIVAPAGTNGVKFVFPPAGICGQIQYRRNQPASSHDFGKITAGKPRLLWSAGLLFELNSQICIPTLESPDGIHIQYFSLLLLRPVPETDPNPNTACSSKTMYPDWLSLTGEGYVASMYKKYGKIISPMGCRAFLSPWYERGEISVFFLEFIDLLIDMLQHFQGKCAVFYQWFFIVQLL